MMQTKWVFTRVYNPTSEGRRDFGVIYDEENRDNVICLFEKDISDLDGRKMAYAREMFDEMSLFIDQVNHGKLKPKEACKKFEALMSKIKG